MNRFPRHAFPEVSAAIVLLACLSALAVALAAQYLVGLRPCVLCIAQRVPFAVAAALIALALVPVLKMPIRRWLLAVAAFVLAVNCVLAFYHVGVEQAWWHSSVCPAGGGEALPSDLAAAMSQPVEVPCDQPAWSYHGVTMAWANVVLSGLLAGMMVGSLHRRH